MNHALYTHLFTEEIYQDKPKVVVIVSKKWDAYTIEEKTLLSKILGSVKLSLASVQIISQAALALTSLNSYSPAKVIVFGVESSELKPYEAVQAQGFTVLKADDLSELDDAKKKSLWLALKNMFAV